MPGFNLITSNRLEHLISVLADIVKHPLKSPFTPEIIIVQNRGMERLLSLKLSELLGIWAHCEFPFPAAFIQSLFQKSFPDIPPRLPFDPEYLPWKMMSVLPKLLGNSEYHDLENYLTTNNGTALFDLCSKISDQFDRYTVYRTPIIHQWQQGNDTHWQADLWRKLVTGEHDHRAQLREKFTERVLDGSLPESTLPARLSIFGVSTLPPFHLDIFNVLSQKIEIYYYLLNPCAEYWDDICSEKEISKKLRVLKKRKKNSSADKLHFEQGNPLLASMGIYGQDFLKRLHLLDIDDISFQVDPGDDSMLRVIQSDILHLRVRGVKDTPKFPFNVNDTSLQIHSCHNVTRELEILNDRLLDFFNTVPGLKPSDIVVMTPDINLYAPAIEAIFGNPELSQLKIPYSISDRCGHGANKVNTLFLMLLAIPNSRFTATAIVKLLDYAEIRDAFNLTELECDSIARWIRETGIRWSIDGASKSRFDCPPFEENTWKYGINQLLLGYALPPEPDRSFMDLSGYEHVEGTMASTIGSFVSFFTTLVDIEQACAQPHSLSHWTEILNSIIDRCIHPQDFQEREIASLRKSIALLKDIQTNVGYTDDVPFDLIAHKLENDLSSQLFDQGYFNGGVTFCSMLPMRGIPFRVVCCIGMGDSMFPRKSSYTSWDLIASHPQPGDRSLEQEDRYLFLEALCSARDIFYISFIQDPHGKVSGERQSVVVDELLDYCEKAFFIPEPDCPISDTDTSLEKTDVSLNKSNNYTNLSKDLFTIRHKLQSFNPSVFSEGSPHFSYSQQNLNAAKVLLGPKHPENPILQSSLAEPEAEFRVISIADLIYFFCDPASFFLSKRIGAGIKNLSNIYDDEEPFDLQGLEKYTVTDNYINHSLQSDNQADFFRKQKASGTLPHGLTGELYREKLVDETSAFIGEIRAILPEKVVAQYPLVIKIDQYTISGLLTNSSEQGVCYYRYGDMKASDRVRLWIQHLLAQIHYQSPKFESVLLCKDKKVQFRAVNNPQTLMKQLCDLYWSGLSAPLHFFPETSWSYASELLEKQSDHECALKAASKTWFGSEYSLVTPESEKTGNRLLFNNAYPLDESFSEIAISFFAEMIKCLI